MKRALRVSAFNDYVAIDVTDNDGAEIFATPIYVSRASAAQALSFDYEQKKWLKCAIKWRPGFPEKLLVVDIDSKSDCEGLEFDIAPKDLLDNEQFRFDEFKMPNGIKNTEI